MAASNAPVIAVATTIVVVAAAAALKDEEEGRERESPTLQRDASCSRTDKATQFRMVDELD